MSGTDLDRVERATTLARVANAAGQRDRVRRPPAISFVRPTSGITSASSTASQSHRKTQGGRDPRGAARRYAAAGTDTSLSLSGQRRWRTGGPTRRIGRRLDQGPIDEAGQRRHPHLGNNIDYEVRRCSTSAEASTSTPNCANIGTDIR